MDRFLTEIAYVERKTGQKADPSALNRIRANIEDALVRLYGEGPDLTLTRKVVSALEAVIRTDGSRPVLFVENDTVDLSAPSVGDYASALAARNEDVRRVCRAVGRVADPTSDLGYQGTCWVLAPGLVLTNFHVLKQICLTCSRSGGELEPIPGRRFPDPLPVARGDDPRTRGGLASKGRDVFVVGFPGNDKSTTPEVFSQLFHGVKSYKRLSPGLITAEAGEVPKDPKGWVITHDASTLGGNSGSAVVDLVEPGGTVLGLHFGGRHKQQNWAHACERITPNLEDVLPAAAWRTA